MATIVNDRDLLLRSASVRIIINPLPVTNSKVLTLQPSSQVFVVDANNNPDKTAVTLVANRSALTGTVSFSVINGTATLSPGVDSSTLSYANMSSDSVTIRAQITEGTGSNGTPPSNIRPVGHASTPYNLTFNDEFNGTSLDTSKWFTVFPGDAAPTKTTYSVAGGTLNIYPDSTYEKRTITTATTGGGSGFSQKNGYFEIRAKLPKGKGVLPTFWLYTNAPATDRPQIDVMKAYPGGQAVSGPGFTGNTTAPIGVSIFGDQQSYMDGSTGGLATTTQVATLDANIDSSYATSNQSDEWMSVYKWRNNSPGWASRMASSTAKIIIISAGWPDYYEKRTVSQFKDDLRHLIDTARSASTPKYVILQTPNVTDDSSWWNHLYAMREVAAASDRDCPLIDMFEYTQNYEANNGVGHYTIFPNGQTGNQAQHTRMGQYAASRFNAIKASDPDFPQVGSTGEATSGGGGWGTIDFRPTDYVGRGFDNALSLIGERRLSNSAAPDLSADFHYYGVKWEPDGVTWFYDGAQVGSKLSTASLQSHPLYPVLSLWYESASGLAPNSTDTPTGVANAFQIDYIRCWALDTSTGGAPSGDPTDVRPGPFPSASWPLIFSDEFNDSSLNTAKWVDHIYYRGSDPNINYSVSSGSLNIWPASNFVNRTIVTDGKFTFKYGYIEARMKLCRGKGTWPAFWLFNNATLSEIDIMEAYSGGTDGVWSAGGPLWKPTAYATTLWDTPSRQVGHKTVWKPSTPLDDDYHIYGLLWEPDGITSYFDNVPIQSKWMTSAFSSPMYILFDIWYGSASGTPNAVETPTGSSNSFKIDFVRVWSLDGTAAPVAPSTQPSPAQTTPGPTGALGGGSTFATYYDDTTIIKAKPTGGSTGTPTPPASQSTANHLYVKVSGNDTSGNGSSSAPYRTITKAASVALANTTIHVGPGDYTGGFQTTVNGTSASAPIIYLSDTKWGARIIPPSSGSSEAWDNRGNWVIIDGFQVDGGTSTVWRNGIYNGGSNCTIKNNWVHHIGSSNACTSSGGSGINGDSFFGGTNCTITNNLVHHIGPTGCTFYHGIYVSTTGSMKNNLVHNCGSGGLHMWHDARDVEVINNTIFKCQYGIIVGGGDYYNTSGPASLIDVHNNLIVECGVGINESGEVGTNTFVNNLIYNCTTLTQLLNGHTASGTITTDPKFVSYQSSGSGNYRLLASSPAVNAGSATYAPTLDYEYRARGATPDIGAFEYASTGSATRAFLTNEHHTMSADSNGVVDTFAGAATQMIVYVGSSEDTANWTFTRSNGPGVTSTIAGNLLSITSMTGDTGYVDVIANKTGQTSVTLRMSLIKSRRT